MSPLGLKLLFTGVVIALFTAFAVHYERTKFALKEAEAKLEIVSAELQLQANEYAVLKAQYEFTNTLLEEKRKSDDAINRTINRFERKLSVLRSNDPVALDWASTPIPDSVLGLLQNNGTDSSDSDGVRVPTSRVDSPD